MNFKIDNGVVESYKRLSYKPWYAIAEFVDNSTQAYFNHQDKLIPVLKEEGKSLEVTVSYLSGEGILQISDNSFGMSSTVLERALTVGLPPENDKGRSKYGLGMKTAAFWFGDEWSIRTTELGANYEIEIDITLDGILRNNESNTTDFEPQYKTVAESSHYTIITIKNLNRSLQGRTLGKVRDYLSSMYRFDFDDYGLKLRWQGRVLSWDKLDRQLHKLHDGNPFKQQIHFHLPDGKEVKGWVGVLGGGFGGRNKAGFSIIKAKRVINGWPRSYKPNSIFGEEEGGANNLINQRVVGELFLDDFEVSHTKDEIIWWGNEEQEMEDNLEVQCREAMDMANSLRFQKNAKIEEPIKNEALTLFESEVKSKDFKDFLASVQPLEEEVLKITIDSYGHRASSGRDPDMDVTIGVDGSEIEVQIFFIENSEFDPYVFVEASTEKNKVLVIINSLHPHYQEMTTSESVMNFIKHCVYDGVAEWKTMKLSGEIKPYTVKYLKDQLLRLSFSIRQTRFR